VGTPSKINMTIASAAKPGAAGSHTQIMTIASAAKPGAAKPGAVDSDAQIYSRGC
jgi:hypothetical protein